MWRVFDLEDVNVRIGVVISIIVTTFSITWRASTKFAWLQNSVETLGGNVSDITQQMQKQEQKTQSIEDKFTSIQSNISDLKWDIKVLLYKVEEKTEKK